VDECNGKRSINARGAKINDIMEVVKGGKKGKETIKQAQERRAKVMFKPRNKDVLIDIIEIQPKSRESGIVVPDGKGADSLGIASYWEHPFQGYVVAVSPGVGDITGSRFLSVGDHIVFRPPGNPIRDKGHTYLLLSDYDIIGFL